MTISSAEFIKQAKNYKHHALLLISGRFDKEVFPGPLFREIAKVFCGIFLSNHEENEKFSVFDSAVAHDDIFIVDRKREILRLEDVAGIRERCFYPPRQGIRRLFFIEMCERLNLSAANSLLKSIEEPSIPALFLLTARNHRNVLPTIISRCQKVWLAPAQNEIWGSSTAAEGEMESKDREIIVSFLNKISPESVFIHSSITEPLLPREEEIFSSSLKEIVETCERLAGEYSAEVLRRVIVEELSRIVKKTPQILPAARFILANLRRWEEYEPLHPSSKYWLIRLFLSNVVYGKNK